MPAVTVTVTTAPSATLPAAPLPTSEVGTSSAPRSESPAVSSSDGVATSEARAAATPKAKVPQGSLALTVWHDEGASNTCVSVQTVYENRSDTAINSIKQTFQTLYTPKHRDGEYPDSVNGPIKTLTQVAGIAPYQSRTLYWDVCAPELASKQNPPPADGTDSFMSEIGAQPMTNSWTWVAP
ncbi:hypothetical protein GCM10010441_46650 [Kitasatospora paracochleata]